jgi:DNA-binding Lrp family transcriptional regulator
LEKNNQMPCMYCGSNVVAYSCEKCGNSVCADHLITTQNYSCKKHNILYTDAQAEQSGYKCTLIPRSSCPECSKELTIDKLPSGQYFLNCPSCTWDSFNGAPKIHFITKKLVIDEGMRSELIRKPEECELKLKVNQGVQICPNCFIQSLQSGGVTSFATIKNIYNIDSRTIVQIINRLKKQKLITGQIDSKNQVFIYIPDESRAFINDEIQNNGKVSMAQISNRFNVPEMNALELMYEVLKEFEIHGTFDKQKKNYYSVDFLDKYIIKTVEEKGRISIEEVSDTLGTSVDILKYYIIELFKSQKLDAYFADSGKQIVSKNKLKSEVESYSKEHGLFKLTDAAKQYNVAVELVRKSLVALIKEKRIRGLFTQKKEFITEEELSNRIKSVTRVYRTMKLRELALKIGITEIRVEETLASLISRGAIYGFIDMNRREFVADQQQPTTMGPTIIPVDDAEKSTGNVEVLREYDFVGGQLHFKVVVKNHSDLTINAIKVILDAPSSYRKQSDILKVPVISPRNSRGIDFYLEPVECGISTIGGTVIYKDATGTPHTIHIRPKEVQIKCPLVSKTLDTIEDCQITIQNLPSDARAFLIADLDPKLAYRAAFRAITNFDTRNVTSLELPDQDDYKAEAWFSSEAKVTGGRIITRIAVSGKNQSLEIRVWCNDPGQLTGFLAKIIELLFLEINIVRKVKAEERQKTLDVMSITQNLITASDFCAVRYKAKDIMLKLEDTYIRMSRIVGSSDATISKLQYWVEKLKKYDDDEKIVDKEAESLMTDIEGFQNVLARSLAPA